MFCGRACHYEAVQLRCKSDGSGGAYNGAGNAVGLSHSSLLKSWYDTSIGPQVGFQVYAGSSITDQWAHGIDVDKNWYGGAQGPWGTIEIGDEDWIEVETILTFWNVRIYATSDGVWRTKYDSVDVEVNGTLAGSGGAFDNYADTFLCPSSVPLLCGGFECFHDAQAGFFGATGYILGIDLYVSAQGHGTFGIRWKVDGAWITTPIAIPPGSMYASGGDSWSFAMESRTFQSETRQSVGASEDCTTGDGTPYDAYMLIDTSETGGAHHGWLFCDPPREAVRMNPEDYEALVLRYGSYGWESRTQSGTQSQAGYQFDSYSEVHPARSEYLARVTGSGHVFEDLLHETCYCWVDESWHPGGPRGYLAIAAPGVTVLPTDQALYPPCGSAEHDRRSYDDGYPPTGRQYNFPARVTSAPLAGNLTGGNLALTYLNTIASPHYSYFLYFPQGNEWKIGGVGISGDEHWYPVRQQLIDHPSLPGGDQTRHRVDVVAEPVTQNGVTGLIQSVSGGMPCYWGVGRLVTQAVEIAPDFTLNADSLPRWTFEDATPVTGGSDGVVIPAGKNKVSFRIGDYYAPPFELPHLAKQIESHISDPNVTAMRLYLVADDGTPSPPDPPTRVLIGENATGGTWNLPGGTSKKWLTTAAYDGGGGWGSDAYTGIAPTADDGSAAMVGHGERNVTLGHVIPTHTGVRIDWEIDRAEGAEDEEVTLPWPTFHLHPQGDLRQMREGSRHSAMLLPNGPVARYGGGGFFDYGADSVVSSMIPEPALNLAPMAGDWLAYKRPWLLGKDAQDGLAAEIATIFEEGIEYTTIKHLWRDPFDMSLVTHSFLTKDGGGKPIACLVNSYGAVPPTGIMPSKMRSAASGWQATGAVGCYVYTSVGSRKYVASPMSVTVYREDDPSKTNLLTVDASTIPAGWFGGWFRPEQEDDAVFVIRANGKDWFKVRGWRGLLAILGKGEVVARFIAGLFRGDGQAYRLVGRADDSYLGATSFKDLGGFTERPLSQLATDGFLLRGRGSNVVVGLVVDDQLLLADVPDDGQRPLITMTDGPAKAATGCSFGDGNFWTFRNEDGTVKSELWSTMTMSLVAGPYSTNLTGLSEGARIDASSGTLEGNRPAILMLVTDGDVESAYRSTDGKSFTP